MKTIYQKRKRELRTERGLSHNQLAKTLWTSHTHYSNIGYEKALITNSYINMIAEFYDILVEDIVVYAESYYEKYYEALHKFNHLMVDSFDSLKSQAMPLDTITFVEKHNLNILSTILSNLGYKL